jgi:hypothetical protein
VDGSADGQSHEERRLLVEECVQADRRLDAVGALGEPDKETLVAGLALRELGVEGLELAFGEAGGEQPEALAAAGLDEGRHQQAVQLPLTGGGAHQRLEALRVGVSYVAPQHQASPFDKPEHPHQVASFFSGKPGHLRREAWDGWIGLQQREGVGSSLLLAVRMVDKHRVQLGQRTWKPARRGGRAQDEGLGLGRRGWKGGGHGVSWALS